MWVNFEFDCQKYDIYIYIYYYTSIDVSTYPFTMYCKNLSLTILISIPKFVA